MSETLPSPLGENTADTSGKAAAATGGAVGLSAIASFIGLCCIGPWAVLLFGVPGAVTLARFQPVRPYLLILAAVMLAWAFWRVYRPMPQTGEACDTRRRSIWLQAALWISALLLVGAVFADQLQWLIVDPTPRGLR